MKKTTLLFVSVFAVSMVFAQVQTISFPDVNTTVTPGQIKAWGEASRQDGSRDVIVLTFEGLGNGDPINSFYDGGASGQGNSGPDYGVQFGVALGIIDSDAGGTGNFANEPSPSTVMYFLDASQAYMNVPAGFTTGFSFYYSSNTTTGFVSVYDDLNGIGNLLATLSLSLNYNLNDCTGDPTGAYCNWDPVGVSFSGVAKSVVFGGQADFIGFDDVTFGSATPGPNQIPVSNWALIIGLGLIFVYAIIRFRRMM